MNTLKINVNIFPSGPGETRLTFAGADRTATASQRNGIRPPAESCSCSRLPEPALVYVVDDLPCLVELYAVVLEADGHQVKTFSDRNAALAALAADEEKPSLLITDHRNSSMSTEDFLHGCRVTHPPLRILMATGFEPYQVRSAAIIPEGFLKKPFTFEELRDEVRALLAPELSQSV
jgi:DNA-binding NtrC family response regulator